MGKIGKLDEAEVHGFDIECLDMNRKVTPDAKDKNPISNCALYEMSEPFCKECQVARYAVEIAVETDLVE